MYSVKHIYTNLTDAGATFIVGSQDAIGVANRVVERLIICNTDNTAINVDLFLYNASATPSTVKILSGVELAIGETLDVFPDKSFAYDDYYDLKGDAAAGHTADVIINYQ